MKMFLKLVHGSFSSKQTKDQSIWMWNALSASKTNLK